MESIFAYAYDLLKETNQKVLPIRPEKLKSMEYSWTILAYSEAKQLFQTWDLCNYAKGRKGFSYCAKSNSFDKSCEVCIFYADELSIIERHEVIAHEIGHIYLGHLSYNGILGKSDDPKVTSRQEEEANAFALALLAPIPLLIAAGVKTPEEVQIMTRISKENAIIVAGYLSKIYNKTNWQSSFSLKCRILSKKIAGFLICIAVLLGLFWRLDQSRRIQPSSVLPVFVSPDQTDFIIDADFPTQSDWNKTYFWIERDGLYHSQKTCVSLQVSPSAIVSGSLEAVQQRKLQPCKICISENSRVEIE